MSVKSFLTKVGEDFKKGLSGFVKYAPVAIVDATKVETAAQPFLTLALPGIAPEIGVVTQTIAAAAMSVEQKFAAQGLTGAGTQKLAEVLSIVGPTASAALGTLSVPVEQHESVITTWINAVVGLLKGIPVAPATPATPAAS